MQTAVPSWAWPVLAVVMVSLIGCDLVAHRGDRCGTRRGALAWTAVWIAVACAFGVVIWLTLGGAAAQQFFGAYLVEKSLSVDNLFMFVVIFASLHIPPTEQRRVLTWGILGALVTRGAFIVAGAAALARWHWATYILGAILVVTAVKLLGEQAASPSPARSPARPRLDFPEGPEQKVLGWLERHLPWTRRLRGHRFIARVGARHVATPLLLALVTIELTDVVFAIDSVPAAFAVSTDPFIVYSSNIFAILGLRALYNLLAGPMQSLRYLRYGLAAVLVLAGGKMLLSRWVELPVWLMIGLIVLFIGAAALASQLFARAERTRSSAAGGNCA
jgi:TerC family integral membrane protein